MSTFNYIEKSYLKKNNLIKYKLRIIKKYLMNFNLDLSFFILHSYHKLKFFIYLKFLYSNKSFLIKN